MSFNNFKIGHRLQLGFGLVIALLALMATLGILALQSAQEDEAELVEMQHRTAMADEWLANINLNVNRVMALAKSGNNPEVEAYFKPLIAENSERINVLQKELQAAVTSEKGKAYLERIAEQRKAYVDARKRYFETLAAADPAAAEMLEKSLLPTARLYVATTAEYGQFQRELMNEALQRATSQLQREVVQTGVLGVIALLVGVVIAWRMTVSITAPVHEAVRAARAVAGGDLTQKIASDRRDELGELLTALADMKSSLLNTVTQVRSATDSINTASVEIASGNQDLSARTEGAASNLQQTAASMEQLTSTVRNSADAARQANQLASNAAEIAARGGQVVSQVVSTMDEINHSSKKINDIIGVIDGIAFQTNILALNAAVEAARAGEQGRGFAVVAGEVRNLAQRSAEAAKEIKGLINASVERVEQGTVLVDQAGNTMQEIVSSIQRVTDIVGEISSASQEQNAGVNQVSEAVSNMDQTTQQNAALVEESASAAASLKQQADQLVLAVSSFRIDGSAGGSLRTAAVHPPAAVRPAPVARPALPKPAAPRAATPAVKSRPVPKTVATADAGDDWESF